ncbi:universal stress protein [Flavobacterium columnare]|uniref:universal stress protein n=1 Tax=Flavobacterium columnare TaxID=996 RepID=UPI0007F987E9|nr:universal stress protein [Flavobacterium columnare]ANO47291.1 universal stress protein UspA [Flavobacterium columnare]APT22045.1 universal stress protein UspA [Flavobacterium columnare]MBF6653406.1 universal stress protein [Flavobacterium columnare]MBF6655809.1 universal stress protein [Flavobacterium columnare]MBF6657978.1 universal stress protein [Flavobacterium columnare]
MKRILVPTDFSQHAEYALKVAAQFAKKHNAEIYLVHLLELPNQGNDTVTHGHDIPEIIFFKNAITNRMDDLLEEEYLNGIETSKIIQIEHPFEGIMKTIQNNAFDLIIMGSHGASGIKEMFVGSNTEKVVRNSNVPVLVIKEDDINFKIDHFVFASDFLDEIKKPFENIVRFANELGATLHLVNINTPNNFRSTQNAQKLMADFVSGFKIDKYETHIYNDTNVEAGILNITNDLNADLIGMCTHGRKGLAHFFNGSISESLVNHSKKPVITFKI